MVLILTLTIILLTCWLPVLVDIITIYFWSWLLNHRNVKLMWFQWVWISSDRHSSLFLQVDLILNICSLYIAVCYRWLKSQTLCVVEYLNTLLSQYVFLWYDMLFLFRNGRIYVDAYVYELCLQIGIKCSNMAECNYIAITPYPL